MSRRWASRDAASNGSGPSPRFACPSGSNIRSTLPDPADQHNDQSRDLRGLGRSCRRRAPYGEPISLVFSQTDTCNVLSSVNGERSHHAHRSRSDRPESCAMRSSSDGHTYRERRRELAAHPTCRQRSGATWPAAPRDWCNGHSPRTPGRGRTAGVLAGREAPKVGNANLDHETATRLEVGGRVGEARDRWACVVKFPMVLKTRYTSWKRPSTRVVAMSPIVTWTR